MCCKCNIVGLYRGLGCLGIPSRVLGADHGRGVEGGRTNQVEDEAEDIDEREGRRRAGRRASAIVQNWLGVKRDAPRGRIDPSEEAR